MLIFVYPIINHINEATPRIPKYANSPTIRTVTILNLLCKRKKLTKIKTVKGKPISDSPTTFKYKIMQVARIKPTETQHTPAKNTLIPDPFLYFYQSGKAKETNKKHGMYNPKKAARPPLRELVLMVPM